MLLISILVNVSEAVPDSLLAYFLVVCILKSGSATHTTGAQLETPLLYLKENSCGTTPVYI